MTEQDKTTVSIEVDKDGWTGYLQVNISSTTGSGYRLAGPKYNGSSKKLISRELTERDAKEIRRYLDAAFPPRETHDV